MLSLQYAALGGEDSAEPTDIVAIRSLKWGNAMLKGGTLVVNKAVTEPRYLTGEYLQVHV